MVPCKLTAAVAGPISLVNVATSTFVSSVYTAPTNDEYLFLAVELSVYVF
jgi:hypothetical protein